MLMQMFSKRLISIEFYTFCRVILYKYTSYNIHI